MVCPKCRSDKTRTDQLVDDAGDFERLVCANDECGYILREEAIVERQDGSKQRRPRRVKPEDQPEGVGSVVDVEEPIPSAAEMMMKAIRAREETVGKRAREIVRGILVNCADPDILLSGQYSHLINETDDVPAEIISLVFSELKERGYKPKKEAVPGEGTRIHIKWPTKKPTKKNQKNQTPRNQPPETAVVVKKSSPQKNVDTRQIADQQEARRRRQKIISRRSELPE